LFDNFRLDHFVMDEFFLYKMGRTKVVKCVSGWVGGYGWM
jgi:hypothetical protein